MTRILLKTFAAGFYKVHAGLLLTLFVTLFINFFFTNVLNQTHLNKEQILLNNLKLVLTSVSNPVAMGILFVIWLGYTIKSCQYVSAQLALNQYQFMFYSCNAMSLKKQFLSWFIIQSVISIPILALGFFAMGVGIAFHYFFIPILIPVYQMILLSGSAFYYTRLVNNLTEKKSEPYIPDLIRKFPKPVFSLFLYQIIYRFKLTFAITKVISAIVIIGMYVLFPDNKNDIRIAGISILSVIAAHTVLIYQSNEFERSYLSFCRNFPLSKKKMYLQFVLLYLLLILPEIILFFFLNTPLIAVRISILGLSFALLLRTILYHQNPKMGSYLKKVFGLFIFSALIVMFGGLSFLTVLCVGVSVFIFDRRYYGAIE
ncbi:hypothetical protein ACFP1I_11705 [Dyadobacter subterraneus]|uniref:Beta-carotene 15,15'-monooxygenase n=1 Tax=Dyadobacter subterraneus TaxID=2773304 RepID=A0ABR9WDM2_9BACT|nr:hypothetical protein [Dyadobacter subterraneus]MBE9463588.1 hypothetical protein [Dyadobacter subterraneus]